MVLNKRIPLAFLFVVTIMVAACTEEPKDDVDDGELVDSIAVIDEVTPEMESSALRPELLGTWKLEDMRMDNEPLQQSLQGDSYLTFLPSGEVALSSEGFAPDTASILQNGDMLSAGIWDSEQHIDSLTMNRLILSEMLDGTEISYIYVRQ